MSDSEASSGSCDQKPTKSVALLIASTSLTTVCPLVDNSGIKTTPKSPGKKSASASIEAQVIRSPKASKSPKSPAPGSTNSAMGPQVALHAFNLLTGEDFEQIAAALGVDKVKLKDVSRSLAYE